MNEAQAGCSHLWAVGYDDIEQARKARDQIAQLGSDQHYLLLGDLVVVVRQPDGSFTLDREPIRMNDTVLCSASVGLVVGLVLAASPFTAAAVGAALGAVGSRLAATVGIKDEFIREVEAMMRPETAALFVLEDGGDEEVILRNLRGIGGTVLKTNVDAKRVKLIQETLTGNAAC